MSFFVNWTWGDIAADEVGPGMFSWFHILSLVFMVLLTIGVCKFFAVKHSESMDRKVVGVFALLLVLGNVTFLALERLLTILQMRLRRKR